MENLHDKTGHKESEAPEFNSERDCLQREAGRLYKSAIAIGEKALGSEHPALAPVLNNQAILKCGKVSNKHVLRMRADDCHTKQPFLDELSRVPSCDRSQGESVEADELSKRAIKIVEKCLGPDHPDLVGWLDNRASLLEQQVGTARCLY